MNISEQTTVELFEVRLFEPVTVLTDLLVSGVCFYAFHKLGKTPKSSEPDVVCTLFRYYFLAMGIATLYEGIIGHGFLYLFGFKWKLPGWIISMI